MHLREKYSQKEQHTSTEKQTFHQMLTRFLFLIDNNIYCERHLSLDSPHVFLVLLKKYLNTQNSAKRWEHLFEQKQNRTVDPHFIQVEIYKTVVGAKLYWTTK